MGTKASHYPQRSSPLTPGVLVAKLLRAKLPNVPPPTSRPRPNRRPTQPLIQTTLERSALLVREQNSNRYYLSALNKNCRLRGSSQAIASSPNTTPFHAASGPAHCLGRLETIPGSLLPSLAIDVDRIITSLGRDSQNTFVHPDSSDTRIPKTAFKIFWYAPDRIDDYNDVRERFRRGAIGDIAEDLRPAIITHARSGIHVNGTHLAKTDQKGRTLYAHLHTGDRVQAYGNSTGSEYLEFLCNFSVGLGKNDRAATEPFEVKVDDSNYRQKG